MPCYWWDVIVRKLFLGIRLKKTFLDGHCVIFFYFEMWDVSWFYAASKHRQNFLNWKIFCLGSGSESDRILIDTCGSLLLFCGKY